MHCRLEPIACGSPRYVFTDRCPRTAISGRTSGRDSSRSAMPMTRSMSAESRLHLAQSRELGETLLAIHRIGNRASVMTAGFAEHASVRQPHSGHGPVVRRISRNVGIALDADLTQNGLHSRRERRSVAERVDIDPPVGNRHCTAIGEIELAIETAAGGPLMAGSLVSFPELPIPDT